MQLKIKKLREDAIVPTYGTEGAACFDIYATNMPMALTLELKKARIRPGQSCTFGTDLAFEVPEGFVMMVFSRSGHGFKSNVRMGNCVGIIDSDYRGQLHVILHNDAETDFYVNKGDRIAQAMLIPYPKVEFEVVDELSDTGRGTGGLGSTGK